jgi:hypothetical protein
VGDVQRCTDEEYASAQVDKFERHRQVRGICGLEETDDQDHHDDFTDLCFEVIEVVDLHPWHISAAPFRNKATAAIIEPTTANNARKRH